MAAMARSASSEKRRSTPSIFSSAWYSRTTESGGAVMTRNRSSSDSGSSSTRTGRRPRNSAEQAVVEQLLLGDAAAGRAPVGVRRGGAEAHGPWLVDEAQVGEGAGGDEQDVLGVDHHEVVLVPVLRDVERHEDLAPLEQLEQRLLHALAADVARAGAGARALAAARDLVDLVDEDDAALRQLDVLVGAVQAARRP